METLAFFISFFPCSSSFSGFFGAWTLAKPKNQFFLKKPVFSDKPKNRPSLASPHYAP
jgi:hypothetical protein